MKVYRSPIDIIPPIRIYSPRLTLYNAVSRPGYTTKIKPRADRLAYFTQILAGIIGSARGTFIGRTP